MAGELIGLRSTQTFLTSSRPWSGGLRAVKGGAWPSRGACWGKLRVLSEQSESGLRSFLQLLPQSWPLPHFFCLTWAVLFPEMENSRVVALKGGHCHSKASWDPSRAR